MSKLNFLGFSLILLFVGFSFYVMFSEPHNFRNIQEISQKHVEDSNNLDLESHIEVANHISGSHEAILRTIKSIREDEKITEKQYLEINDMVTKSLEEYNSYKDYIKSNVYNNDTERTLYSSLWYLTKARALTLHYDIHNCVDSSLSITERYTKFFFFLKKGDRDTMKALKEESNRFNNYMEYKFLSSNYPYDRNQIISDVKSFFNIKSDFYDAEDECEKFKINITNDYNYQNFLLKYKIVIAVIVIIIFFIAGKILTIRNIREMFSFLSKKTDNTLGIISSIIKPKEIKQKTIEGILKVGSIATTIATLGGVLFRILNLNWFLLLITVVCVISLLLSILFGIISVNNNSEKMKKWTYYLFLFGMFLFIWIILQFIVFVSINSITTAVKQSIANYLSNSTSLV